MDEADGAGDADGLGETRKKELVKSGMLLGLRQEDDVFVIESAYVSLVLLVAEWLMVFKAFPR